MKQDGVDKLAYGGGGGEQVQALPRVRRDVEITEQVYYGKACYVLKDPTTLRYYRLRPPEHLIYTLLDGGHTMEDVLRALAQRFPGEEYDGQAVMSFIVMLRGANLLEAKGETSTEYLLRRKKLQEQTLVKKLRREYLFFRIPLMDPDKVLGWLDEHIGPVVYSKGMLAVALVVLAGALGMLASNIDKLGASQMLLSPLNLLYMAIALFLIKPIHEFGHGLTAKHFGCEVHEMGILFLVFMPCAYCEVSDAWMVPVKGRRMAITGAGIMVEVVLAALATYVWALTESRTLINQFALNVMIVASLSTFLFNANPLLRYDGYYFLMDLMEIPNLKQKGQGYLWYLFQRYVLGVDNAQKPVDVDGREPGVLGFAVASAIYRWFIMFAIAAMVWRFLDPYGWGVVGAMMALSCIYGAFVMPLVKFTKFVFTQRHRIHIRVLTAVVLLAVIGSSVGLFLMLPVEQTIEAQCVLRPAEMHPLYVGQAGFIDAERNESFVEDGQLVEAGTVLMRLSDPEVEQAYGRLGVELEQLRSQQKDYARMQGASARQGEQQVAWRLKGLEARYERARQRVAKLTIRSPASGRLQVRTERPLRDLAGSFLPVGAALFAVYEPGVFEAVTAINHRDNGRIAKGQQVEVKLWAWDAEVFEGEVVDKPGEPVRLMSSAAFSAVFGGEVATLPAASEEEALEPADVTYELEVPLAGVDERLRDGMVGRTKIVVERRTLGGAFWFWLLQTLQQDIRL